MLEPGGELDLALEPLGTQAGRELRVEHFESDRPVVPEIMRQVDRRHTSVAELALEAVPVGEICLQSLLLIEHRSAWMEVKQR